jgi:segregation and condensation protein B
LVRTDLEALVADSQDARRGIEVRKVASGYKMFTKAEHHDAVRRFVKSLRPKLKLSLPALETLAVIAYKQPVTVPEIQAVRGVSASGTIHTLLQHKLVTTAGRKAVIGRPMLYKTTKEFLVQFGLNDVAELPDLKEFEELSRAAFGDEETAAPTVESGQNGLAASGELAGTDEPASVENSENVESDESVQRSMEASEGSQRRAAEAELDDAEDAAESSEPPQAAMAAAVGRAAVDASDTPAGVEEEDPEDESDESR